ncbi:hypothetical protein BU14_0084s0004 [Porphyra umbilicalis]|uniref:Uncharacterized protein n=1 Tax=Porphyra umbilicalis TaxID=2786 RepID=A0A1X6PEE1_PORUM|nr:hypothetical protein BU14_0084s0004 [Porphyra umbilicalis]|eukprot:OSX79190.1 hypothetical protein BU14_0084s0004 [Porphyra umbilicalis]
MPPPMRAAASAATLAATSVAARRATVGINMPSRAIAAALLAAGPAPLAHKVVLEAVRSDPSYGGLVTSATHFKKVLRAMTDAGRLRVIRDAGNVVRLDGAGGGVPLGGGEPVGPGGGGRLVHRPVKPVFKLQLTRKGEAIYRQYLGMEEGEKGGAVGLAAAAEDAKAEQEGDSGAVLRP